MPPREKRTIGYEINQAARLLRRDVATELRHQGIDDDMYIVLRNLGASRREGRDGVTLGDMATELSMSVTKLADASDKLARDGWVDSTGARMAMDRALRTTPKADAALHALEAQGHWTLERALSGFTDTEVDQLRDYLRRMIRNLE